jgi:GT2 family glycosyltransferase
LPRGDASIVISYNARADLERCLSSLTDAPPAITHDIIVVDNASTDDSVAVAGAAGPVSPSSRRT